MSKSKQPNHEPKQAPRRPARTLVLKPLDFERRFIDDLISCSTFVKTYDDKKLCFTTVGSTPSFSRRIFGVRSEKEKHCGPNHQRRNRSDDGWLAPGD